jgi:hypothetical protein
MPDEITAYLRLLKAYGRLNSKIDEQLGLEGAEPTDSQRRSAFRQLIFEDPEMLDISRELGLDVDGLLEPTSRMFSERVSRKTFDGVWPFSVEWGILSCQSRAVTFIAPDGTVYGLNGWALDRLGAAKVNPIALPHPDDPDRHLSIGDLEAAGRRLCERGEEEK